MIHAVKAMAAVCVAVFFVGCANYASLQDADVMEKGKGSFGVGISYTSYTFDLDSNITVEANTPALNLWYRKGISDKFEVHANMWFPMGLTIGVKYQLVGSLQKPGFGFSTGLDGGYLQLGNDSSKVTIVDLYVPLYTGFKFSENFGIYLVPKYIPRFVFGDKVKIANIIAGTGGIRVGKNTMFMVEGTYGYDATYKKPIVNTAMGISF